MSGFLRFVTIGQARIGLLGIVSSLGISGCDGTANDPASGGDPTCTRELALSFTPDIGTASEAYVCYGFDADAIGSTPIRSVRWDVSTSDALTVHHAILYAVTGDYPDGPVPCGGMPEAGVEIHVWSPGSGDFELPPDVGLRLADGTRRFVVEVHALRAGSGGASESHARICAAAAPLHEAAHVGMGAPVPAIRPLHVETSSGGCTLAGDIHLWSVWPHMHKTGKEILGELVRANGAAETLVDVTDWDFTNQKTYPLSVDATSGDSIRVSCTWDNQTTTTILPGPLTEDEMCNLAFIGWPASAAVCR
jgi:hypothetical protein